MTDVIEIDGAKALTLLREIVKDHEDFVYEFPQASKGEGRCVYQHNGEPSCLVGKALFKAGATIEELSKMDNPENAMAPSAIGAVSLPERIHLTADARDIFSAAQIAQDNRNPWGEALTDAEHRANIFGVDA